MVPLKNAHDSGGWAWSATRKRDYANDFANPQHLIAVDDGTNQSKGARGPEAWKPPLQSYWCRYALDWIGIKRFCQISDNEALRARDLVVARPPPDSASAVSPPQMAPDFRSLSEI